MLATAAAFLFLFYFIQDNALFQDVSDEAGILATHRGVSQDVAPDAIAPAYPAAGSAWADYDGDGWVDLFVAGNLAPNALYRNNGDGSFAVSEFSDMLSLPDAPSGGAAWADYDNDGWRDLYVLNMGPNRLFRNLAGAGFADVTLEAGVGDIGAGMAAAWGDYDEDGQLDLYVANGSCAPACEDSDFSRSRDALFRGKGDGSFTDVSGLLGFEALLGAGSAVSWVDYDNDRDLDLYVVNDSSVNALGNVLWRNDGPGCGGWCFHNASEESGAGIITPGMGLATGDYDNDGDLDFYVSNMLAPMTLLENTGDGHFINAGARAGLDYATGEAVGWGAGFFDYDNDGWLDLYLAATGVSPGHDPAGTPLPYPDMLYHNRGDGGFAAVSQALFSDGVYPAVGFSAADYDRDGRVDFLLTRLNEGPRLLQNRSYEAASNGWIAFELQGGGAIARDAFGARVKVVTDDGLAQVRELRSGAGDELLLHFGLGGAAIERVIVSWLNGEYHEYTNVLPNQRCLITWLEMRCEDQP